MERKTSLSVLRRIYEESPTIANRLLLAQGLCDDGLYQEAMDEFTGILETHREDKDALFGMGASHMGLKDFDKAVEYFSRIIDIHPGYRDYSVWTMLAEAHWENGDRQKSLDILIRLNKIYPRLDHEVLLAKCHAQLGDKSSARRVLEDAIQDYRTAPPHVKEKDQKLHAEANRLLRQFS